MDKNTVALADSFMAIFGLKRIAVQEGNVIKPKAFEQPSNKSDGSIDG